MPRHTLGWGVLDWFGEVLAAPDRTRFEPFTPTDEQALFVLRYYETDSSVRRRRFRRGILSRAKGWGKSPLLSAIGCAEALGPVVPDGMDGAGEPVGRPWADLRTPWVQFAAVSEKQTGNAWGPLLEMLRDGPACDLYVGLEPLDTFVNLPKGKIEPITASAVSAEGNRPVFAVLDQTESWLPSNGGTRLAATLRRNLGKTGGSSIEAPNAFRPGERSVAEMSSKAAAVDSGILNDHREGPPVDLSDGKALLAALRDAYGDSAAPKGWVDLRRISKEVTDPATDEQDARQYYLNQIVVASDVWLDPRSWAVCAADPPREPPKGQEPIALGFDGSISEDSTGLVGCTGDGHLFLVGLWEKDPNEPGWRVPDEKVDAAVGEALRRWRVVRFYADPPNWQSYIKKWMLDSERIYRSRQPVVAEFWTNQDRKMAHALEQLHTAVVTRQVTHDGSPKLAEHMGNARRFTRVVGTDRRVLIRKDREQSSRKIDLAVCATLAYAARTDALADGLFVQRRSRQVVGL